MNYLLNLLVTIIFSVVLFGFLAYGEMVFPYGSTSAKVSASIMPVLYGLLAFYVVRGTLKIKMIFSNLAIMVAGILYFVLVTLSSQNAESGVQFTFVVLYLFIVMTVSTLIVSVGFGVHNYFSKQNKR